MSENFICKHDNDKRVCSKCHPDTFKKPECSSCGSILKYKKYKNTHIWICSGDTCPIVEFEYLDSRNTKELNEYLERDILKK